MYSENVYNHKQFGVNTIIQKAVCWLLKLIRETLDDITNTNIPLVTSKFQNHAFDTM